MLRILSKSVLLLALMVVLLGVIYPLSLWIVGQAFFPFEANGSLLADRGGKLVGSQLIAQPFTKDEYFQPRPSAAGYDASASASSSLAPSNYLLRDRVARALGQMATYQSGLKAGEPVGADVERWFQADLAHGQPHIVAQWATLHGGLAQAWAKSDPSHAAAIDAWAQAHPAEVAKATQNSAGAAGAGTPELAVAFFVDFSSAHPGRFPSVVTRAGAAGHPETRVEPVAVGPEIQSTFFDLWRQDHPDADLALVPADLVTTSASGLDPHLTLASARFQLPRVASKWASDLKRDQADLKKEIEQILQDEAEAPLGGLVGEKLVNVLRVNLELYKRYGPPPA